MSARNPNYVSHSETIDGTLFYGFPPREMPTHAIRRAAIAALLLIKNRNEAITDANQKDKVSIVVFDTKNENGDNTHVQILQSLTDDYTTAMSACAKLQACGSCGYCTDSDGGFILARKHLKPNSPTNPDGGGRANVNKVVIFLTDGSPNLYETPEDDVDDAQDDYPGGWGSGYSQNGVLYQTLMMRLDNWYSYPVGVGLGGSQSFMNKVAVMAGTDENGHAFTIAEDSATYEANVKTIFNKIITNPKLRLVQ